MVGGMVKRDNLGRERKPSQGGAGSKSIPSKSHGAISGLLESHEMPDDLDPHGVDFWTRATDSMRALGILEKMDWALLYVAAATWSVWQQAREDIKDNGLTIEDDRGRVSRNHSLTTMTQCGLNLAKMLSDLGLTPSARAKFGPAPESDEFEKLFEVFKDAKSA